MLYSSVPVKELKLSQKQDIRGFALSDFILLDRHRRAVNILFKDGRVERVGLEEVCRYQWHREFTPVSTLELP